MNNTEYIMISTKWKEGDTFVGVYMVGGTTKAQCLLNAMISKGICSFLFSFLIKKSVFLEAEALKHVVLDWEMARKIYIQIIFLKVLSKELWFYPVRDGIYFGVAF